MVRDSKINYVEFNASDIPAIQKFYADVLDENSQIMVRPYVLCEART